MFLHKCNCLYPVQLMKQFRTLILAIILLPLAASHLLARQGKDMMTAGPRNYKTFSAPAKNNSKENTESNKGYEQHPEFGMLYAGAPCDGCYELIDKRTETSKTFVKEGTGGREIMQQTSSAPMHYKDKQGNWRTISTQLKYLDNEEYGAFEQEIPVLISARLCGLGKNGSLFEFNRDLELIYDGPSGIISLGKPNWSNHTAGDDGVYVTDAWPGIDIEMFVLRGAIKTNFWIKRAMPAYANGKLLIRDHFRLDTGLSLDHAGKERQVGNLAVKDKNGNNIYAISAATAFEKNDAKNTLQMLEYGIDNNTVDISLPGSWLNRPASSYPVIIDPLVSTTTSTGVAGNGSSYIPCSSFLTGSCPPTGGCAYTNPAIVPAKVTITDVQFSFQYVTSGGALLNNGAFDFVIGGCKSPTPTGLFWNCNTLLSGTCTSVPGTSIFSSLSSCMPAPQCMPYNLDITMNFYQNYASTPSCSNAYISAGTPLTITVFGKTVDASGITAVPSTLCQGQSASLSAGTAYGVPPYTYSWVPGGYSTSAITVTPSGTTTYSLTVTDACGAVSSAATTVTVSPMPVITGTPSACKGNASTLTSSIGGGTWRSSAVSIAVVSSAGVVTGNAPGTAAITYTTPAGCAVATVFTVLPLPAVITGPASVCRGSSIMLTDATTGGTWSSSNPGIAGIAAATGIVTGNAAGTATISYAGTNGCTITASLTVSPISPASGAASVCPGGSITLSDATTGGIWSSSRPAVATINGGTGVLGGVAVGTSVITYNIAATGCFATTTISINALSSITGANAVCQGTTVVLSNSTPGGTWSSGSSSIATIGASSGIVTGVSGGIANITYTAAGGCFSTTTLLVNPNAAISGTTSVCQGSTTTLSSSITGGTWSSSNVLVATASLSGGVVSGISAGTATIRYYTPAGCLSAVTTNVLPPPAAISGSNIVCQGSNTMLSDLTPGGTWASSNLAIGTIGPASGVFNALSPGTAVITYTTAGNCYATASMSVNPLAPVTGSASLCAGASTNLADATPAGTWSSSDPAIATVDMFSGTVTAITGGTVMISYTTPASCVTTFNATVNPVAPVTGNTSICGSSVLSNAIAGGTWATSNPGIAAISASSGIATGISAGTAIISYTTGAGCLSTAAVTVNPYAAIAGPAAVCAGSAIMLGNAVSGGVWSSSNATIASVDASSGTVSGLSAGAAVISYTTPAGCVITKSIVVNPISPISGPTAVCQGGMVNLSDATPFGGWSSGSTTVATVSAGTGIVSGTGAGVAIITYTSPAGCTAMQALTVNPTAPILGATAICQGSAATLSDAVAGGTWSSTNPSIASIDTAGNVTAIIAGLANIRYTTVEGCIINHLVTVNSVAPITGPAAVCQGNTATLANAVSGGTWMSGSPPVAAVGLLSGTVTGIAGGTASITYITAAGCNSTAVITVNPVASITGASSVCTGNAITMSDGLPGGTWSSSNASIATIDASSGVLTGVAAGTSNISYTTTAGCATAANILVNQTPGAITGTTSVCVSGNTPLHNTFAGGAWSTVNTAVAMVGRSSGVVAGISADTTTIIYATTAGCYAAILVTVNPLPASITGVTSVCAGASALLSDATTGGIWSSSNPAVASIDVSTGIATTFAAGTANISYTTPRGCYATTPFNVHPVPPGITGAMIVCSGYNTTLSNSLAGGTWATGNAAIATVAATSGVLYGASAGTVNISYTTPYGCYTYAAITVNPTPQITGASSTNPTKCTTTDGIISLSGLVPGEMYSVHYNFGGSAMSASLTADIAGIVFIRGLAAGTYTNINVTSPLGCTSNTIAGPISLTLPLPPPVPIAGNNSPLCAGNTLQLTATDAAGGVAYSWTGPGGFSSTQQNPLINSAAIARAGVYSVTASLLECTSAAAVTTVVIHPIPNISDFTVSNPTTCLGTDGAFNLLGLVPGVEYTVVYNYYGDTVTANDTADASGKVTVDGLRSGTYTGVNVTSFTCLSNTAGPINLTDPSPAPPPALTSNSPICSGKTLILNAENEPLNLEYLWTGPNGFSSNSQNISIPEISQNDSGDYTLTIRYKNCPSSSSIHVGVYPPVMLNGVTPDQMIPIGGNVTLHADGALLYMWTPNDGSLSNPSIDSPVASPQETTVYTVLGINTWGCRDSAHITVSVDFNIHEFIPTAFSPNGDGRNDVFRILNLKYGKLADFSIYNRWGQLIYKNTSDPSKGWDGTFNGVPQPMGVYNYSIIIDEVDGKQKRFTGDVTLIR